MCQEDDIALGRVKLALQASILLHRQVSGLRNARLLLRLQDENYPNRNIGGSYWVFV